MASNTSRPEGIRKIGSTSEDMSNRVSVLDYFNLDRGVATFRGIEGGSGVTVSLVDADGREGTNGSVIRITSTGGGGSGGNGALWYSAAGTPGSNLGADSDMYLNSTNGDVYQKQTGAWVLQLNIKGANGASGATGTPGAKGDQGDSAYEVALDNGYVGTTQQWLASLVGPAGVAGAKGDKGDTGSQGPQGIQGVVGSVGPQGPQGAAGSAGAKGDKGDTGDTGAAGAKGDKGDTGTGIQLKGALDNAQELPGSGNAEGDTYLIEGDLFVYTNGAFANAGALQGPKGDTGTTGAAGPAGAVGPQGPKGDTGATGSVGPAGNDGATGPAGAQGIQGVKGDTGATGTQGIQGVKGDTGSAGAKGDKGDPGAGVPVGGTTGQILSKASGTDYDTTWIAAPSGGGSTFAATSTDNITVAGAGTTASPLTATVKLSGTAGNAITSSVAGLYAATGLTSVTTGAGNGTTTVSGAGTSASPLVVNAKVSTTTGNQLTTDANGLFVAASSGSTFAATDTGTIDFSGAGTSASPLTAVVKVSGNAGNIVTSQTDGIFVAPTSVSTTATVVLSGNGTSANALAATVKKSATANNILTLNSDGVFVPSLPIQSAGTVVQAAPTAINFTGAGVTVSTVGTVATVNIPTGSGGGASVGGNLVSFLVTFNAQDPSVITGLPSGWTYTTGTTTFTVTHNTGKRAVSATSMALVTQASNNYISRAWNTSTTALQQSGAFNSFTIAMGATQAGTYASGSAYVDVWFVS